MRLLLFTSLALVLLAAANAYPYVLVDLNPDVPNPEAARVVRSADPGRGGYNNGYRPGYNGGGYGGRPGGGYGGRPGGGFSGSSSNANAASQSFNGGFGGFGGSASQASASSQSFGFNG